jgi:hypothetical protein
MVLEYGIRYFPKKTGISLLFENNSNDTTPFQEAYRRFGYEQVTQVIEETLTQSSSSNAPQLNIIEALLSAAIDENTHLDCVYF